MAAIVPIAIATSLAPTGILRVAINFGNSVLAQRHPVSGAPSGVSVDLAKARGERTGIPDELVSSPPRSIAQVDQAGIRVSVADQSAYDLYLTRTLQHAAIVRAPTGNESIEMFLHDRLEVAAGVRTPLERFASANPGLRVIDGRFMSIEQAMATPKGRSAA